MENSIKENGTVRIDSRKGDKRAVLIVGADGRNSHLGMCIAEGKDVVSFVETDYLDGELRGAFVGVNDIDGNTFIEINADLQHGTFTLYNRGMATQRELAVGHLYSEGRESATLDMDEEKFRIFFTVEGADYVAQIPGDLSSFLETTAKKLDIVDFITIQTLQEYEELL